VPETPGPDDRLGPRLSVAWTRVEGWIRRTFRPLDSSAVVPRMNESVLFYVNCAAAEPWARVNAPPTQHDDQQQRDSDNEPSKHEASLRAVMSLHAN
jgi:hypothetical protein